MKKQEILKRKGIKIREMTSKDRKEAKTDYARRSNYIIKTSSGEEFYSINGSLKDALQAEKAFKKIPTVGQLQRKIYNSRDWRTVNTVTKEIVNAHDKHYIKYSEYSKLIDSANRKKSKVLR